MPATSFAGLKTLSIQNATGLDLSVLPQLTTLQTLDLSGTTLPTSTLDAIGTLPELKKLVLQSCAVTAINPLVGLSNLEYLDLTNNSVTDLTAITALEHLKDLYLTNNPVKSITYLNSCLELERLHIENCGVSRLSSLAGNTSLQELYASNNEISDISVLSDCVSLSVLDISDNQVKDVSVIANLPELTYFLASHNQIESLPERDRLTNIVFMGQIAGCGQGCQAGTDDICGFMINALRLFGTCKCFVVATGIVHGKASLLRFFLSYSSSMLLSMATVYPALARRTTNKLCPLYKI